MEFHVLLDAPAKPVSRIQIAKLGDYHDNRYGDFSINAENVANWQRNLSKLPGGEALIDFEHRSERKPRDSSAAGWITSIDLDGDRVMADARWTPKGKAAIENEEYRFLSPVFGPAQVESETLDEALPSVALTNKPFLAMAAVCLASEERVSEAIDEDPALRFHVRALDGKYGDITRALVMLDVSQAERDKAKGEGHSLADGSYPIRNAKQLHSAAVLAASKHGNWQAAQKLIRQRAKDLGVDITTLPGFAAKNLHENADSRAPEMERDTLIKTLDLEDGADDAKILETLTTLKQTAGDAAKLQKKLEKKPLKTLEQQAQDAGLVILEASQVADLTRKADAGEAAMKQLHESRFETVFTLALEDPRGARVTPAEKDRLRKFYQLDADETLKLIEEREPIVPAKPRGAATIELDENADPADVAAAGLYAGNHDLYGRIRKYMLDKGVGETQFPRILEQYMRGEVAF